MNFPPEEQLLLVAIGAVAGGDPSGFLRHVHRRLDWDRALRLSEINGLAPILYEAVRNHAGPAPTRYLPRLERTYHAIGFCNARLHSELACVLGALGRAAIPVILLKGAAFAETLWRNIALRSMADLDLLVREEDLTRAQDTLLALGYQPRATHRSPAWYLAHHHHLIPCVHPGTGTVVELHRNITAPSTGLAPDPHLLWSRSERARVADMEVRVLSPNDALMHICLHIAGDDPFLNKARSLADLVALVQTSAGDLVWPSLVHNAPHLARFLYYPLWLARQAGATAVPEDVMTELRRLGRLGPVADALLRRFILLGLFRREADTHLLPRWSLQQSCEVLLFQQSAWPRILGVLMSLLGVAIPERAQPSTRALLAGVWSAPVRLSRRLVRRAPPWRAGSLTRR